MDDETKAELPQGGNTIVESNAIVHRVTPDVFVFIVDETNPEWKESARSVVVWADFVVQRRITDAVLSTIRERLSADAGVPPRAEGSTERAAEPPHPR